MNIRYSGKVQNGTRCGIITYKRCEEEKALEVINAIENEGYAVNCISCDDTIEAYFSVFDNEEYDDVKEIYLEAKRA